MSRNINEPISTANAPERKKLTDFINVPGKQFVVPIYQRRYTWETTNGKHQVKQLLDDFENIVNETYKKHFIGILISREKTLDFEITECSIIDGQQRLVTIFLMLWAIRKAMESLGVDKQKIDYFDNKYIYLLPGQSDKYKLTPQVSDDDVYKHIIENKTLNNSEKESLVYKSYTYIYDRIYKMCKRYGVEEVQNSLNFLYFVYVPVTSDDYPQKIFESINAYGAKLKKADLIKNFLLTPFEDKVQEKFYEDYWEKIEDYISSNSEKIELFFRCFVSIKNKKLISKDNLFDAFTQWYSDERGKYVDVSDEDAASTILAEIVEYARCYSSIYYTPLNEIDKRIRDSVSEFRDSPSLMPAPLLVELLHLATEQDDSVNAGNNYQVRVTFNDVNEIIKLTTIYLMRRWLCGINTNSITTLFARILKNVFDEMIKVGNSTDIVEYFKKYLVNGNKGLASAMPTDLKLAEIIRTKDMYEEKEYLMVFFKKYENYQNLTPVEFKQGMSIEHLMPQTSTPLWIRESKAETQEVYEQHYGLLGNLSIGTPPYQARTLNHIWEYKKDVLNQTSGSKLNRDIINKESWTIDDIKDRTEILINAINDLYPYFETNLKPVEVEVLLKDGNAFATGKYNIAERRLTISKESVLEPENDQMSLDVKDARKKLQDSSVLDYENGKLVFKKKHKFSYNSRTSSLDFTAKLILGRDVIGEDVWKTSDGQTSLRDFLNQKS